MTSGLTIIALREGVVTAVTVPDFSVDSGPGARGVGRIFLVGHVHSKFSVVIKTGLIFVPLCKSHEITMVFENAMVFLRVKMEVGLGESAPGHAPPMEI